MHDLFGEVLGDRGPRLVGLEVRPTRDIPSIRRRALWRLPSLYSTSRLLSKINDNG